MLQNLGIGWASSILGFISLMLVPLPFILERVSGTIRKLE
jgi:DHA1 family multidrug resistance protein-like MFS transporter